MRAPCEHHFCSFLIGSMDVEVDVPLYTRRQGKLKKRDCRNDVDLNSDLQWSLKQDSSGVRRVVQHRNK